VERFLIISGRVISFILGAVGILLLVVLFSGILLVNAAAVVPAFGQNLVSNHVIDDLRTAVWQSFTDSIPTTITIGQQTIDTVPLVAAFSRARADIINSGVPLDEWLRSRAEQVFFGAITDRVQAPVTNLQQALSDSNAAPLVNLLLAALDQCTDTQVAQIQQLLGTGPSPTVSVAVSFLCRPPESLGVSARELMRNALTLMLAEVATQASDRVEERLSNVDLLSNITFDTPVGPARLDWPNIRVGSGILTVSFPIPESIVQAVDTFIGGVQTQVGGVIAEATQRVDDAQATLQAAGSALATEVNTRMPSTLTPTATPIPTPAEDPSQSVSPLEQRILNLFEEIGAGLADISNQFTTILLLLLGIPFLLLGYLQLYLMRAIRWWMLWIGLVLAISGALLFAISDRLVNGLVNASLTVSSDAVPNVLVPVINAAIESLHSAEVSLISPFQSIGLFMAMAGVALVAVAAFLFWNVRQKAHRIEPALAADTAGSAAPSADETDGKPGA